MVRCGGVNTAPELCNWEPQPCNKLVVEHVTNNWCDTESANSDATDASNKSIKNTRHLNMQPQFWGIQLIQDIKWNKLRQEKIMSTFPRRRLRLKVNEGVERLRVSNRMSTDNSGLRARICDPDWFKTAAPSLSQVIFYKIIKCPLSGLKWNPCQLPCRCPCRTFFLNQSLFFFTSSPRCGFLFFMR